MNKAWIIFFATILGWTSVIAQPWEYDFGTGNLVIPANTASTTLFPTPQSGTARVRVGNTGGSINLENPGLARIGTDSEMRIVGPTSSISGNKFSIYDFAASKVFYTRFDVCLGSSIGGAVNNGVFYFLQGNGTTFSSLNNFVAADVFSGIQWTMSSGGVITTNYLNGSSWIALGTTPFSQTNVYTVEIFGNNSSAAANYDREGVSNSLNANTQDIWVNGSLIGDDLPKAMLSNEADVDSFSFHGLSSNAANCFVDNLVYSNSLPEEQTLPVELSSFTAVTNHQNQVSLQWVTQSETGMLGYYVHRGVEQSLSAAKRISSLIEATNTSQLLCYQFTDTEVTDSGLYYYWLQACDLDGVVSFHGPITLEYSGEANPGTPDLPLITGISSLYPNPFSPRLTVNYALAKNAEVVANIYNIKGQKVRTFREGMKNPDNHQLSWDGCSESGGPCASGVYWLELLCGTERFVKKLVLAK